MIAQRDDIRANVPQLVVDRLRDAEAVACCVLTIYDRRVDLPLRLSLGQILMDRIHPRPADNIADKKDAQLLTSLSPAIQQRHAHIVERPVDCPHKALAEEMHPGKLGSRADVESVR